jgi:fructokinase
MPAVIALGELLIDFVPTVSGVSLIDAPAFQKAPGGAPGNVAVGLCRLGISSGFMGMVGEDPFGHFLESVLHEAGVDTSALCFSPAARTGLAFVSLRADGEREFIFYRHPSADMLFAPENVDEAYVRSAQIFHYGSISLISEPSASATLKAVTAARQGGLLVSYDPNLRLNLWPSADQARQGLMRGWELAHIIKASQEELEFLSGETSLEAGARRLWRTDLKLLVVTLGKDGSAYFTPEASGRVPGFPVTPVDTTGAGDGFVAGLLKGLIDTPAPWQDPARLAEICRYANAVGALTTTQRGAIPALPTASQVEQFISALR